jgi:hypothetical protein
METSLRDYKREEVVDLAYNLGLKYIEAAICPQATFAALQDVFQFRDDTVFKSLTGYMGGGGDTCEGACGGVIGGIAAIGYLFGRSRTEFDYKISDLSLRVLVKRVYDQFKEEFGGILCKDVHMKMFGRTFNIFDKDEEKLFLETLEKDKRGGCGYPVAIGASIAAGVIWDELHNPKRLQDERYYL